MGIFNILDQRRENEYNPEIDVVYEIFADRWEDHGMPTSTEDYTEWMHRTTVYSASCIAQRLAGKVTMFLYDPGWIIDNYGFIIVVHPKLKRDVMVPHEMDTRFLRPF